MTFFRRFNQCWNEQLDKHAEERKQQDATSQEAERASAASAARLFQEEDCGFCSNELRDGRTLFKSVLSAWALHQQGCLQLQPFMLL